MDLSKRYRTLIAKEKAKWVWIDAHKTVYWAGLAPFLAVLALPLVAILLYGEAEAIMVGILIGLLIGSLVMWDFMAEYFFNTYGTPPELPPKEEPLNESKVTPDPQCPSRASFAPSVRCHGHLGHEGDHQGAGADGNIIHWKDRPKRIPKGLADVRLRFNAFMEDCWTRYEINRSEKGDSWMESNIPWLHRKLQEERYEVERAMYTPILGMVEGNHNGAILGSKSVQRELIDETLVAFMLFERFRLIQEDRADQIWEPQGPTKE